METLFLKVLNMSLSAALVIVVVLLARLALKRSPKKWSYLLWLVVAFRLVCPVSFSAPFSILRLTAQPAVTQSAAGASEIAYIPTDIGMMAHPRVYMGTTHVSDLISGSLPAPAPTDSANPLQIWTAVGAAVWCAGAAALLLYAIISYLRLRRRMAGAVRAEEGIYETDAVRSPFILGLLRPTIYLPVGLEGETLHYVLAHERFHIRRGDHAAKLLAYLLLTVHWFNPLVWLSFVLMSRDMEMRCDEAVLSGENGITKPYSMALLSFASGERFPAPSPLCFGETGVKERIKNALRWRSPKTWVSVAAALLCVVAVAACAANPVGQKKAEGTPWDWTSTVTAGAIKSTETDGVSLNAQQTETLVKLLNEVKADEVVRGRGIPSNQVLDITTGVGYRLRWDGGIIELDFADNAAAAELYGSPETLGPGVWEIHNDALYAFLEELESGTPASGSDLAGNPGRDAAQLQQWNAGVNMIGEEFVSASGEAGQWRDVRSAFAARWCEKHLNAGYDSPYRCSEAIVQRSASYLNAVSLTGTPRYLAFDLTLALAPADPESFVAARAGWATKYSDGHYEISAEVVLRSDDGARWTVEALNTGGSTGWGFRHLPLEGGDYMTATIPYILSGYRQNGNAAEYGTYLLQFLPNLDWEVLSADQFNDAAEMLRAAALKPEEPDFGENDQLYRDLYMLWGLKRVDGFYAELFLDGPESLLATQYLADKNTFEKALAQMDDFTQRTVRGAIETWQ